MTNQSQEKSIFRRMMTIDHRIIYVILAVAIAFPLFNPVGFPVAREAPAAELYRVLTSFPAGTPVLFTADFSASGAVELRPMVEVLVEASLLAGHRIILMALWADGANLMWAYTDPIFQRHNSVYGVDWVDIGFVPQSAAFLDNARSDLRDAWNANRDRHRDSLDDFPLLDGIYTATDIHAVVSFGTGSPGWDNWVGQWRATGHVDYILAAQVAVNYPNALAAFNAGNIQGVAGGLGGAATLEMEHGIIGSAHGNSDAQSFGHAAIILFLILGNIGYFGAKKAGEVK